MSCSRSWYRWCWCPPLVGAGIGLRLARTGRLPRWPWPVAVLSGLAACYLAVMLPYGLTVSLHGT
ncbi:hypothetical protein BJI67_02465 [Acidihalobacter aeolianus]|uniref:Uncharacterized protein n=1 Tax=Acidihalobacter aeolianus TaxID=2792603 RepID=A0A1D8K551_9GAMM|nr:hypothetical protein [Acidihalobacter aeolianus]AOV16083.1 hypothetical protein BJI67_02465 [Acidihalobacter aeolianus]